MLAVLSRWLSAATPPVLYAGGVTAISRWLSAATPPARDCHSPATPVGVAASRRIGETPRGFHLSEPPLPSGVCDEESRRPHRAGMAFAPTRIFGRNHF